MSRFFQDLEEETKSIKSKKEEVIVDESIKLSKKEKKILEIESKVNELKSENDKKKFEKKIKMFFTELKKYDYVFGKNIPEFLETFLRSDQLSKSKFVKQADNFLNKFSKEEEIEEEEVYVEKKKVVLSDILKISDEYEKEDELIKYYSTASDDERDKINVILFSLYYRRGDVSKMIESLNKSGFSKQIVVNLDGYLEKIYLLLKEENYIEYEKLLKNCLNVSKEIAEIRYLEFKYFVVNDNVETDNLMFKLLYYVRNGRFIEGKTYFYEVIEKLNLVELFIRILEELEDLACKEKDFYFAFDVARRYYFVDQIKYKTRIYSYCVILNEKIKEDPIFTEFINDFSNFRINTLALPSIDVKLEVFRAFYLINDFDYEEASNIIDKVLGCSTKDYLEEQIHMKIVSEKGSVL